VEAHPIYSIAIPLKNRLLRRFRAHTRGMSIQIADAAMSRKETTRLVVTISAIVITLDLGLLLTLSWFWRIRLGGEAS
jgi:hypothetical protein